MILTGRGVDDDEPSDGCGVDGSCFTSGLKGGGTGGSGRGRGGLAGALPFALALGLNSRMNWFPAFMAGFGVVGTGGLKYPPWLVMGFEGWGCSDLTFTDPGGRHISKPGVPDTCGVDWVGEATIGDAIIGD